MEFNVLEDTSVEVRDSIESTDIKDIVIFNDDYNTFQHVIDTLIKVCKHDQIQAEQCTWIIHFKGKCAVKKGSFTELKPMKEAICEVGIDAKIH
jgi:ATP-dependent Clp protease adaptor protein ClpS